MATFNWGKIREQEFTLEEARKASDFEEVVFNWALEPDEAFDLLDEENLNVGNRLFLAEKVSIERMPKMILEDRDPRIRAILKIRMDEERLEASGGIII